MNSQTTPAMQKSRAKRLRPLWTALKYVALLATAFVILMPILWFVTSSFRSNNEVFPWQKCFSEAILWKTM